MNSNREEKIEAMIILEVIGRPPEHLVETLNKLADEIGKEKDTKVKSKKVNEPVLMKEQKDFYVSFAEIEVEAKDMVNVAIIMFKYMPAHIEIISPERIEMKNNEWNEIFNETLRRLHAYDEVARIMQMEKDILEKRLKENSKKKD